MIEMQNKLKLFRFIQIFKQLYHTMILDERLKQEKEVS